jgi:hypothetical protein
MIYRMRNTSSGTAGDLLAYLDSLTHETEAPWPSVIKSAARQVFLIVDGDDFAERDVTKFDVDEYLQRFEDDARANKRYAPRSLSAYQSRFRRAIDAYRTHLLDPSWRPRAVELRARTSMPIRLSRESSLDRDAPTSETRSRLGSPSDSLTPFVTYPFPLKSGEIARLHLPPQLDADDAERLVTFIQALVVQGARAQRQDESG